MKQYNRLQNTRETIGLHNRADLKRAAAFVEPTFHSPKLPGSSFAVFPGMSSDGSAVETRVIAADSAPAVVDAIVSSGGASGTASTTAPAPTTSTAPSSLAPAAASGAARGARSGAIVEKEDPTARQRAILRLRSDLRSLATDPPSVRDVRIELAPFAWP